MLTEARKATFDEHRFMTLWYMTAIGGGSVGDVAEALGMTPGNVATRASLLRKKYQYDPEMLKMLPRMKKQRREFTREEFIKTYRSATNEADAAKKLRVGLSVVRTYADALREMGIDLPKFRPGAVAKHENSPEFNRMFIAIFKRAPDIQTVVDELKEKGYDWTPAMVSGRATYLRGRTALGASLEPKPKGSKPGTPRPRKKAEEPADPRAAARQQARELFAASATEPNPVDIPDEDIDDIWDEKTDPDALDPSDVWGEKTPVEEVPDEGWGEEEEGVEPPAPKGPRVRDIDITDDEFSID